MKKTLLSVFALFTFLLCNAQVKTHSNYDVDDDGNVSISDVTKLVDRVLGKVSDDHTVVDAESLNATFQEIFSQLDYLKEQIAVHKNSCSCGNPYDPNKVHEYVDLGLPSGLKWATCNVGANSPEEYGNYYAWGATEPDLYDNAHTPYQTNRTDNVTSAKYTKYLGSTNSTNKDSSATNADALKTILDPEDDAAHVNWGGDWRMPTYEEEVELRDNCYWKWVVSYNGKPVNGYIVYKVKNEADKGKYRDSYSPVGSYSVSDPHIFLPAAGYRTGSDFTSVGTYGHYNSSSLDSKYAYNICQLTTSSSSVSVTTAGHRQLGYTVRPVCQ